MPGHGHYLLARAGQDVGAIGDAEYDVPLFERKGGLALRDASGETGRHAWSGATARPATSAARPPPCPRAAPAWSACPAATRATRQTSGDNAADFVVEPSAQPAEQRRSASRPCPPSGWPSRLDAPGSVGPGSEVDLRRRRSRT